MKTLQKLGIAGGVALASLAGAQEIRATVDGIPVNFPDVEPMMIGGRVMVPLRGVFEHMGATVLWDAQTQTVTTRTPTTEVRLPLNSYSASVDGLPIALDVPARLYDGRTMVPLRFTAEAMKASVDWVAETRTVQIQTMVSESRPWRSPPTPVETILPTNTVIPFRLDTRLSSRTAVVGDRYTATLSPGNGTTDYQGLPEGTQLEGRVETVSQRDGSTPGVLGLQFDRIRLPDGHRVPIVGSLIGLDSNSVVDRSGRWVARQDARDRDLKYVGYGAGAGVLLSVLGKGNLLTNALIGGALGYLAAELERDRTKSRDVDLAVGTRFGVRLDRQLIIRSR